MVDVTLINVSAFAALTAVGYRRSSGADFADLPAVTGHTVALASVSVEYDSFGVLTSTRTVSVVVERSAGTSHLRLSAALYRHIARDTEGRTAVRVRFVDYRWTAPGRNTESKSLGVGASRSSRFPTLGRSAPSPVQ